MKRVTNESRLVFAHRRRLAACRFYGEQKRRPVSKPDDIHWRALAIGDTASLSDIAESEAEGMGMEDGSQSTSAFPFASTGIVMICDQAPIPEAQALLGAGNPLSKQSWKITEPR